MLPNSGSTAPKRWWKLCRPRGLSILHFMRSVALAVDAAIQRVLEAAGEDLRFRRNRYELALGTAYFSRHFRSRYVRS
jgi:hypothetical protein